MTEKAPYKKSISVVKRIVQKKTKTSTQIVVVLDSIASPVVKDFEEEKIENNKDKVILIVETRCFVYGPANHRMKQCSADSYEARLKGGTVVKF